MNTLDSTFIANVEKDYFRTDCDVGANSSVMLIWNQVRRHVGLDELKVEDLPAYCTQHGKYHVIRSDYGCVRDAKFVATA